MGGQSDFEGETGFVDEGRGGRGDVRLPHELVAPVTEGEGVVPHDAKAVPLFREVALDLEQIGEVGIGVEAQLEVDGVG